MYWGFDRRTCVIAGLRKHSVFVAPKHIIFSSNSCNVTRQVLPRTLLLLPIAAFITVCHCLRSRHQAPPPRPAKRASMQAPNPLQGIRGLNKAAVVAPRSPLPPRRRAQGSASLARAGRHGHAAPAAPASNGHRDLVGSSSASNGRRGAAAGPPVSGRACCRWRCVTVCRSDDPRAASGNGAAAGRRALVGWTAAALRAIQQVSRP